MSSPEKLREPRRRRTLIGELPSASDSEETKNDFRLVDAGETGDFRMFEGGFGGGILTRAYLASGGQLYMRSYFNCEYGTTTWWTSFGLTS